MFIFPNGCVVYGFDAEGNVVEDDLPVDVELSMYKSGPMLMTKSRRPAVSSEKGQKPEKEEPPKT